MNGKVFLVSALLMLVLFFGCVSQPSAPVQVPSPAPVPQAPVQPTVAAPVLKGPVSDGAVFKIVKRENAADALLSGEIDYYMDSLPVADAVKLQGNPDVALYPASASIYGFYLNPAPAKSGELNPFSIQKVRFALQYLVDREAVVKEAFSGLATPTATNPWPGHPSYETIRGTVDGFGIKADLQKATALIDEGMLGAGAAKQNGSWTYKGKPVLIKIYSSDNNEYRGIIGIVAQSLSSKGFGVNVTVMNRTSQAKYPPESTDPAKLEWHLAPTGWLYYDVSTPAAASVPGLDEGESGWWAYNNTAISDLEKKMRDCKSLAEWEMLDRELAGAYLNDSTGFWLAVPDSTYAARKEVKGLAKDSFVGIRAYTNIREANVKGKSTLVLGTPGIYYAEESWNPVVINNLFMMDVVNSIYDPAIYANPKTLVKGPFRWGFAMDGGPTSALSVPSDAFAWNYTDKRWAAVGDGKVAKMKITYDLSDYIGAKWHHGQKITWADVLYFTASTWDRSFDAKKQEISSSRWAGGFDAILGMRINGNYLEVYQSEWSVDNDELLVVARMFQRSAPMEEYAAMDAVVFGGNEFKYQYGESEKDITSLCLVNETHVQDVLSAARALTLEGVSPMVTAGGKTYLTQDELSARVSALEAWNAAHKHLIINDGAFYMDRYDAESGNVYLKAFRDSSYPYSPGHWKAT